MLNRKKMLFRFLKENNCYQQFFHNFEHRKDYHLSLIKDINHLIEFAALRRVSEIHIAFCWAETLQNHRYWEHLDKKWYDIIYNNE